MIDGVIDFTGTKEEAGEWLEKFLKDFKKEKSIKGKLYRIYAGTYALDEQTFKKNLGKPPKSASLADIEELEEDSEELPPPPPRKSLKRLSGYA